MPWQRPSSWEGPDCSQGWQIRLLHSLETGTGVQPHRDKVFEGEKPASTLVGMRHCISLPLRAQGNHRPISPIHKLVPMWTATVPMRAHFLGGDGGSRLRRSWKVPMQVRDGHGAKGGAVVLGSNLGCAFRFPSPLRPVSSFTH